MKTHQVDEVMLGDRWVVAEGRLGKRFPGLCGRVHLTMLTLRVALSCHPHQVKDPLWS